MNFHHLNTMPFSNLLRRLNPIYFCVEIKSIYTVILVGIYGTIGIYVITKEVGILYYFL